MVATIKMNNPICSECNVLPTKYECVACETKPTFPECCDKIGNGDMSKITCEYCNEK